MDMRANKNRIILDHPETREEKREGEGEQLSPAFGAETVLFQWQAKEYEKYERSARWYLAGGGALFGMVVYALVIDSPIMAILFILFAVVGYIQLERDPRNLTFTVTTSGIYAGEELYAFDNIASFWIFYEPPHTKILSLRTHALFLPFVHIPLGDQDPVELREKLLAYNVSEVKQEKSFADTLERIFHI